MDHEPITANAALLRELSVDTLGGDGVLPSSGFTTALTRDFGSALQWRAEFTALAKAMGGGSGWALLSWLSRDGRLVNHRAADDTQLLAGATPVLALDMHTHASIDALMAGVRWDRVYRRYGAAVAADALAWSTDVPALRDAATQPRVIDVRRPEHRALTTDTMADAVWRDPALLPAWSAELDPAQPVVVCCVHGLDVGRSTALALRARGIDARYLVGGIEAWREAGLPMRPKGEAS
jgi:superoxide dismutase, Fe-Mn family